MIIEHGPRELRGVSQLQYVGADDADFKAAGLSSFIKPVGLVAAGLFAYAVFAKKPRLKKRSGQALLGTILLHAILPP